MVVANAMSNLNLKVSATDSDSSSIEESDSDIAVESVEENVESDAEDIVSDEESVLIANEGWGNSVAKILGTNKPKKKKTLVLSRAKKHSDIKVVKDEKSSFEVIGEGSEKKPDVNSLKIEQSVPPPTKKAKQEKPSIRQKPNILEKDRERILSKIATKGVVQLFNAVRNQQKTLEKELDRDDVTELKKEKILKKFDKRTFLDTLMGKTKSVIVDEEAKSSFKDEVKNEEKPRWNALREDFMMGAKMKDWDKEVEEE